MVHELSHLFGASDNANVPEGYIMNKGENATVDFDDWFIYNTITLDLMDRENFK